MRVYIAGPMSGFMGWNYPAFAAEAARLRALGHEVISPHEVNAGREADGWEMCLRRDIAIMLTCDAVQMLHGWPKSRGACMECRIARELGLKVYSSPLPLVDGA